MADDFGEPKTYYRHEASAVAEKGAALPSQMNDDYGVHELQGVSAHELPAEGAKKGDAAVLAHHAR